MPRKKRKKRSWLGHLVFHHGKNQFIPHAGNDHVPHVLRHHRLFGYSLLFVFLKAAVLSTPVLLPAGGAFTRAITPSNIISLTNATRAESGLGELEVDERLSEAARLKARDMLQNQYFAHESPTGISPVTWIQKAGYPYQVAGENLAVHFAEAEDVQSGWMASPTHRANILEERFEDIGVGVVQGDFESAYTTFVVQMFGAPRVSEAEETKVVVNEPAVRQAGQPEVDLSTMRLAPTEEGIEISVEIEDATSASVLSEVDSVRLTPSEGNWWVGTLPPTSSDTMRDVTLVTSKDFGEEVVQPLVSITPSAEVKGFFHFVDDSKRSGIAGIINADSVNDLVQRIYFYMILVLGFALLLSVAIKFEIQRHSILAHGLLVLILGAMLMIV